MCPNGADQSCSTLGRADNLDYLVRVVQAGAKELASEATTYAARIAKGEVFASDPAEYSTGRTLHDNSVRLQEAMRAFGPMFSVLTGVPFTEAMKKQAGVAL